MRGGHRADGDSAADFDAAFALEPSVELVEDRVHRMKTVRQAFAEGDWITGEQINAPKDALDQRDVVLNAAAQRHASYVA